MQQPYSPVKKLFTCVVLVGLALITTSGYAQLKSQCQTCFASEIVSSEHLTDQCTRYELKVYYTGKCDHELSHVTVAVPTCATVSDISNDQNFTQVLGYDPTTGLTGFKIDNVSNFGDSNVKSMIIKFTLCSSSECPTRSCWSPAIAYKAGNCFELDSAKATCANLKAHLNQKNISCSTLSDGRLDAIVDSGVPPYQYLWSSDSTGSSISHLTAGNYSVKITDATGSNVELSATVQQPSAITITPSVTSATCNGKSDGSISLSVSGGTGTAYSYVWNTGATTSYLDSIRAGNYSVTVKDSVGCQAKLSISVGSQKQIIATANTKLPSCNQSDGAISLTTSGGTEPYHYLWSTGDTTSFVSNVGAGAYSVTITDAEGCSAAFSFGLHENNTLKVNYNVTPTSCLDNASGAIDISVTGGTQPYSFLWSNGATTEDLLGLTSGSYTVTVTDSAGCSVMARIFVFKKTFQVASHIDQPKCYADSTGAIFLTPSGGVAPYTFLWSNGSTADSLVNLPGGTYMVTVTDSTGCSSVLAFTITSPKQLDATVTTIATSCNTSSVDLTVTGGSQPYSYQWSNGAQTQDLTNVGPGTYSIVISDANSCSITRQVQVDSVATTWSCLINPVSSPACLSTGNMISTSVTGTLYAWSISSSDSSWHIQSGASTNTLVYQAGNANTSATFTLTITKDGCTQSCSFTLASCSSNTGGTGGGNNEDCKDAFSSTITKTSDDGSCAKFSVTISTDGNSRHDLSHVVIGTPSCAALSDYSANCQWPLVIGKDPTTGITGIKVDNVSNFGDQPDSFTVEFTLCYSDCAEGIQSWSPVVAYKAGLCIAYDTLSIQSTGFATSAYPNPFKNSFQIEYTPPHDDVVTIDIYNQYDQKALTSFSMPVTANVKNELNIDGRSLPHGIYVYRMKTSSAMYFGRVVKVN